MTEQEAKDKKEQEENARKERDKKEKRNIWVVILLLVLFGVAFIAMISFQATSKSDSQILEDSFSKLSESKVDSVKQCVEIIKQDTVTINHLKASEISQRLEGYKLFFITFGTCLLIAGACFVSGAFTGFLFGIPRIIQKSNEDKNIVMHNDNFVQISDWLTKIIVGIALTEIYKIPSLLNRVGEKISPTINSGSIDEKSSKIVAIAIVLYFLILGFLAIYLWTRIYFGNILKDDINASLEPSTSKSNNKMADSEKPIE
jgi:flagellar basal body-associated protein FliL